MDVHRNNLPDRRHRVHLYRLSAGFDRVDQSLCHGRAGMRLLLSDPLRAVLEKSEWDSLYSVGGLRCHIFYFNEHLRCVRLGDIANCAVYHHFGGGICNRRLCRKAGRAKDLGFVFCGIDKKEPASAFISEFGCGFLLLLFITDICVP